LAEKLGVKEVEAVLQTLLPIQERGISIHEPLMNQTCLQAIEATSHSK